MIIRKAYKFKLKVSPALSTMMSQYEGANRFVWNKALALNKERLDNPFKQNRRVVWYNDLAGLLKLWKQSDEWSFLRDVQSQTLQQTLKDLDRAMKDAFNPKQRLKHFPVFKKKHENNGFRFPQGVKVENGRIYLPKIGWVRYFNSQPVVGDIKNATISKRGHNWYVAVQVEVELNVAVEKPENEVGIDLGIAKHVTLSDGGSFDGARSFKQYKEKLTGAQRQLSKKVRFSSNWKKAKAKVQKIHEKISHIREDRLHWVSTTLSRQFSVIYMEDLSVRNMSKSAKGSMESPGKNVKQKAGLNREILDQAWGEFSRQLMYKQEWSNGILLKVDPKYTSQQCSNALCGHIAKENRESQARFLCKSCGHTENADVNAAKNILAAGHAAFACGGDALATPLKQEPLAA